MAPIGVTTSYGRSLTAKSQCTKLKKAFGSRTLAVLFYIARPVGARSDHNSRERICKQQNSICRKWHTKRIQSDLMSRKGRIAGHCLCNMTAFEQYCACVVVTIVLPCYR